MSDGGRPGGDAGTATSNEAASHPLRTTVERGTDTSWRMYEVLRLHEMGLHPIPIGVDKKPVIKWRRGDVDYVVVPPSVGELERWARWRPVGWGVTCGGPSRLVVLDVEGPGLNDPGEAGTAIRRVLNSLPETCQRATPGGGRHAFLRVLDGDVPSTQGHRLMSRVGGAGEKAEVLLAEYRTESAYAMVLGLGRGRLPGNFAVHPITRSELDDLLATLRKASPIQPQANTDTRRGGSVRHANEKDSLATTAFLKRLHSGVPCDCVLEVTDRAFKTMAEDKLTPAILGPVLSLLKLGARGHVGVLEALHEIEASFLERVVLRSDRSGGVTEAQGQWDVSVDGAVRLLTAEGIAPRRHASCDCWLDRFMSAFESAPEHLLSKSGQARITDAVVMSYLVSVARRTGSRTVSDSQRQISESVDISAKTIGKSIARLHDLLWVERRPAGTRADHITLLDPLVGGNLTTTPTTPGVSRSGGVVVKSPHSTHRMFGPKGLGPGVGLTYGHLPEMRRSIGRRVLLAVGHRDSGRDTATMDLSRRPPAPSGPGLTNGELAVRTRRDRSTIRVHLNRLADWGMAFRDSQGRWWRYAVDLDAIADQDRIPHTRVIKKQRHDRERRAYYEGRVRPGDIAREAREDGSIGYVDCDTGEFVWIDHGPPAPTSSADAAYDAARGEGR